MPDLIRRQIDEITRDPALRIYVLFLSLGHLWGALWWIEHDYHHALARGGPALCWPFFERCFAYRLLDAGQVQAVFVAFAAASVIGGLLFLHPRLTRSAWLWQLTLNGVKALILLQDFRLRMNQHYMLFFATCVFLFLPGKRALLRYTLVMFYVWASTLKLNAEWISGAALYGKPWGVPEAWLPAACVYVVVLEAGIVWGLLSRRRWIGWLGFVQVCLFHAVSWTVVSFFYPLLMLGLLSIFPLCWLVGERAREEPRGLLGELFGGRAGAPAYAFLGVFSALQLVPHAMPGDARLTGEGRLLALHMFDAQVECRGSILLTHRDGETRRLRIPTGEVPRIRCDPAANFSLAKRLCHNSGAELVRLDLRYAARRAHERGMRPLVEIDDFCRQELSYDMWRPNAWIQRHADRPSRRERVAERVEAR